MGPISRRRRVDWHAAVGDRYVSSHLQQTARSGSGHTGNRPASGPSRTAGHKGPEAAGPARAAAGAGAAGVWKQAMVSGGAIPMPSHGQGSYGGSLAAADGGTEACRVARRDTWARAGGSNRAWRLRSAPATESTQPGRRSSGPAGEDVSGLQLSEGRRVTDACERHETDFREEIMDRRRHRGEKKHQV